MHLPTSSHSLAACLALSWSLFTRHHALAELGTYESSEINLTPRDSVPKTTSWNLQVYNQSAEAYTPLPGNASADFYGRDYLSLTYNFDGRTSSATNDDVYTDMFGQLSNYLAWVTPETILQLVANPSTAPCPTGGCSSYDDCKDIFKTISDEMKAFFPRHGPVDLAGALNQTINAKYQANVTPAATLNCVLLLHDTKQLPLDQCDSEPYDLTIDNWNKLKVDDKLQVFMKGGNDLSDVDGTDVEVGGLVWPGIGEATLSAQLREQLTSANTVLNCSLKNPCQAPPDCDMVGQYFTRDKPKWRSQWGYSALWALRNINQELTTQYIAIQAATIDATLATFNVDTYFPKPNKKFPLLNVLTGLGTAFAVVSGFLGPLSAVAAATTGAVGAIAPAVGTYFERYYAANVDRSDPNVAQKTFAPKVRQVYDLFINALDNITSDLFAGREIEGQVLLTEMMRGGRWVNPQVLTEVSDAKEQIFYEIFARSLDALWKTPTSDKRWVLFVDLQEEGDTTYKCGNNTDGPPDLRYCADGGVYYAYNFVEKGDHLGFLSYPWGADQLKSALKIDPAVISFPAPFANNEISSLCY